MPHSVPSAVSAQATPVDSDTDMAAADVASTLPVGADVAKEEAKEEVLADEEDVAMADGDEASQATAAETAAKGEADLANLFADDDDDDEFPSSLPPRKEAENASQEDKPKLATIGDDLMQLHASDPEVMRSFYQRLFPWRHLFQWLNHSPTPTNDFGHREFAFTLQNDAYLRYQSFPTAELLRKDVLRLMPSRFEIGPVYTTNPRDRKALHNMASFKPLAKELCFDIDLTDYDDIRTCCDKTTICRRCWQFITMAIGVVDSALRDDFGFRHILWVYSGRRGAHAWVCDKKARTLDDARRRAIAGYLEVVRGGAGAGKKVNQRRPLHPHVARSLQQLRPHFQDDVLRGQDPWDTPERAEKLLQLLPDRGLVEALRRKWEAAPGRSSAAKWSDIDAVAKSGASKGLDAKLLLEAKQDIVLEYTYPRLDIEVSKKLNHLLKSPFVVHPGTGRVCVPIDTARLDEFDPLDVPTVQTLLQEIDIWDAQQQQQAASADSSKAPAAAADQNGDALARTPDWEKTSLKPYIEQFRSFVLALMRDEKDVRVKREREEAGSMEF